jgi:hypothetical protein
VTTPQNKINAMLAKATAAFEQRGGTAKGKKRERAKLKRQWTRQIIKTDRFDQIEWFGNQDEDHAWFTSETIVGVRHDPEVDAAINDLYIGDLKNQEERPGYLNGPELLQDVFYSFYQAVPKLHKKGEVVKDARLNGKFIEQLMALPAFEEIRDYTIGDAETAKGAMLALVDVIKEMIKQHREAVEQSNEDRKDDSGGNDPFAPPGGSGQSWDEETPGSGGQSQGEGGGEAGGGQSDAEKNQQEGKSQFGEQEEDEFEDEPQENWDHKDFEDETKPDFEEPQAGTEGQDGEGAGEEEDGEGSDLLDDKDRDFNDDLDDEYDEESNWERMMQDVDFGSMANSALEQFADEQEEIQTAVTGIGLTPEEWKMMDPRERMRLASRLNNPRMKQIADIVGRMKRYAQSRQQQKVNDSPHEIYTIEQGNDLVRTVRSEFGLLGRPETKVWFYYKFINGELLQYKKRGQENVGKGPMIVCIDNSGSMGGAPENWAKAVAEALRRIAADNDRDFYAIYFETNYHRERFDFPGGKGPLDKIMTFLSVSAGGGTEFDGVLEEALQKCVDFHEDKPEHGKSDIVFITDGQCPPGPGMDRPLQRQAS